MKKLLFVIAFLQLNSFTLFAQQQNWKLNENLYDYQANTTQQLFNDSVDYVQNALTAPDGSLLFYVQDGVVLTPNQQVIVDFRNIINWIKFKNLPFPSNEYKEEFEIYGFSEVSIFPNPEKCNQFYVALGANVSPSGTTDLKHYLVWSIIEVKDNATPTAITLNNGETIDYLSLNDCQYRPLTESEPDTVQGRLPTINREYYLAVTSETAKKNRLLFLGLNKHFGVFKTINNGFLQLDCNPEPTKTFIRNIRSESEVYKLNDSTYQVVTPYYREFSISDPQDPASSYFSVFNITLDASQTSLSIQQYDVELPHENNTVTYPKGFEFSENGLILYVSMITYEFNYITKTSTIIPGINVAAYQRNSLNQNFNSFNFITLINSNTNFSNHEFGFGMIERGLNNTIYFAGKNKLGVLNNSNVPVVNFNSIVTTNSLETYAAKYYNLSQNYFFDAEGLKQNLLIDQVDLEDATNWYQPGYLGQLPQNMVVCNLPTAVNLPVSADVYYNSSNRFSSAHFEYNSNQVFIHSPGYYKISFCNYEHVFQVIQDTIGQQGANFNWSLNNNNNQVISITTTPINTNGISSHVWELYELQNGTPVLISTQTSTNASFTGLTHQTTYQIVHTIVANTTCLYNNQSIATIHTGGIINSGTSKAQ